MGFRKPQAGRAGSSDIHYALWAHLYVAALGRQRVAGRCNCQLPDLNVRHVLHTEDRLVQLAFGARAS